MCVLALRLLTEGPWMRLTSRPSSPCKWDATSSDPPEPLSVPWREDRRHDRDLLDPLRSCSEVLTLLACAYFPPTAKDTEGAGGKRGPYPTSPSCGSAAGGSLGLASPWRLGLALGTLALAPPGALRTQEAWPRKSQQDLCSTPPGSRAMALCSRWQAGPAID